MENKADNSDIRKVQLKELEILKAFTDVCDRYDLKYYMVGGTLIGGVYPVG